MGYSSLASISLYFLFTTLLCFLGSDFGFWAKFIKFWLFAKENCRSIFEIRKPCIDPARYSEFFWKLCTRGLHVRGDKLFVQLTRWKTAAKHFMQIFSLMLHWNPLISNALACIYVLFFSVCRCHYFLRRDGLAAICISSVDYPRRVAFNLINDIMSRFELWLHEIRAPGQWPLVVQDDKYSSFKFLQEMVIRSRIAACQVTFWFAFIDVEFHSLSPLRAQDPADCDRLCKARKKIEDVKSVLHKSFQTVLRRGETLDQLITTSEDISEEAKIFVKKSKKSKCCLIM